MKMTKDKKVVNVIHLSLIIMLLSVFVIGIITNTNQTNLELLTKIL